MTRFETVGGSPHVDLQAVDSTRLQEFGIAVAIAVACAQHAALQLDGATVGEDITQARAKVGVDCTRARIKDQAQMSHDIEAMLEWDSRVAQHVWPPLHLAHINAAGRVHVGNDATAYGG